MACAQLLRRTATAAKRSCTGRGVAAVMVSSRSRRRGSLVPISSAAERPSWVSEAWRNAARFAQRRGRQMNAAQQFARAQHVGVVAGDEIDRRHLRAARRRAARACRRPPAPRSARSSRPAGSDMQMLPPTVAAFQILNDARSALQHCADQRRGGPFRRRRRSDRARRCGRSRRCRARRREASSAGQPRLSRSISVSMRGLRLGEQPGAAGQPGIAVAPLRDLALPMSGRRSAVTVLRSMLARPESSVTADRRARPGRRRG